MLVHLALLVVLLVLYFSALASHLEINHQGPLVLVVVNYDCLYQSHLSNFLVLTYPL